MSAAQRGFIAIDRGMYDHPVFQGRDEWLRAFQWLIAQAAYKPCGVRLRYGVADLQRGQLARTVRALAAEWQWTKSKVWRFLKALEAEAMLTCASASTQAGTRSGTKSGTRIAQRVTVITICNYDKFQNLSRPSTARAGQKAGQEAGQGFPDLFETPTNSDPQPLNQTNHTTREEVGRGTGEERGRTRRETKPPHGAKGRGMVWFDHGTEEWRMYADDYRSARGAEIMPESRIGGRGNWFLSLGEATRRKRA